MSRFFVVAIFVFFLPIFLAWWVDSANFFTFRMYGDEASFLRILCFWRHKISPEIPKSEVVAFFSCNSLSAHFQTAVQSHFTTILISCTPRSPSVSRNFSWCSQHNQKQVPYQETQLIDWVGQSEGLSLSLICYARNISFYFHFAFREKHIQAPFISTADRCS